MWVKKQENGVKYMYMYRVLHGVRATYASPECPRWLGGTLVAWLGPGVAASTHRQARSRLRLRFLPNTTFDKSFLTSHVVR